MSSVDTRKPQNLLLRLPPILSCKPGLGLIKKSARLTEPIFNFHRLFNLHGYYITHLWGCQTCLLLLLCIYKYSSCILFISVYLCVKNNIFEIPKTSTFFNYHVFLRVRFLPNSSYCRFDKDSSQAVYKHPSGPYTRLVGVHDVQWTSALHRPKRSEDPKPL